MKAIATTPEIDDQIAANAPVAIGISGGKDSCAVAAATIAYLDEVGHTGARVLIHSDLGRVEWKDSLPTCERLAALLGVELIIVRRAAGDMMDRWLTRWRNNVARYANLECVKLILPWSTPSMRFCTSELKMAVICRELVARFPGQTIISVSGIRREESARRAKAPVAKAQPGLTRKNATRGYDWHPIIDWEATDVFGLMRERGFRMHEAYDVYGSSRVSCAFCILGSQADFRASASCEDNQDIFREMAQLEIESSFSFQDSHWLADTAPELLRDEQREGLAGAKRRAAEREALESRIPKHLLYVKGWPTVMPTRAEAEMLCETRRRVAVLMGFDVKYADPDALLGRYDELMRLNAAKNKPRDGEASVIYTLLNGEQVEVRSATGNTLQTAQQSLF